MRTYGRCFDEFLNEKSPVRLRLLDVPTCFGFSTVARNLILEGFLGRWLGEISPPVGELFPAPPACFSLRRNSSPDFPGKRPERRNINSIICSADSSSSPHQNYWRQMNINILAIPTIPVWEHGLGPANPWMIYIAKETLGFRRSEFSSDLRLLGPTFSLLGAPAALTDRPSLLPRMLSYRPT